MDGVAGGSTLPSFWQVLAALMLVLGLLLLALRMLRRFGGRPGAEESVRMIRVQRLGPKRELQILRVDDDVFTIYRQDGALAVLKREPAAIETEPAAVASPPVVAALGRRLLAMAATAGGRTRGRP